MKESKTTRVTDFLLDQIKSGKVKCGDRILSEYRLADKFNIHKSTANRAVASLVEKGILKRCRGGAGTIVAAQSSYPVGNIGFLLTIGRISFSAHLLNGAQSAAYDRKYALHYLQWPPQDEMNFFWPAIANSKLDGLIVNVHGKDVLDVDEDAMLADLKAEALRSFHLSIGIEYYTKENMPHFVGQAARDSLGLGVGIAYPAAETIKQLVSKANAQGSGVAMTLPEELRPAGLAVAAAPVAAATTESAEANEGKKEEEAAPADAAAGLGDLF